MTGLTPIYPKEEMDGKIHYDVAFKTIFRDFRKFFNKDFNQCTEFIS